jgi:hypothetical protein
MNSSREFALAWMAISGDYSVLVELKTEADDSVTIEKIKAWPLDKAGKTEATKVLVALCNLADIYGVTLVGYSHPYNGDPDPAIHLRLWLGRHGFEPAIGKGNELQLYRLPAEFVAPAIHA